LTFTRQVLARALVIKTNALQTGQKFLLNATKFSVSAVFGLRDSINFKELLHQRTFVFEKS